MTSLLALLPKVPRWVWALAVAGACLLGVADRVTRYGERRYAAGRQAVLDSMAHVWGDSLRWERQQHEAALAAARGRTDTLVRVVQGRTDTLIQTISALSPDVRQSPQVQALVSQCTALAQDCEKMRVAFKEERVRSDSLRTVLLTQADQAAAAVVAKTDTITRLTKRPRWRTVFGVGAVTAVAGFLVGGAR